MTGQPPNLRDITPICCETCARWDPFSRPGCRKYGVDTQPHQVCDDYDEVKS